MGEKWPLRSVAVISLLILLFAVFFADVFGPEDFSAVAYIAPILVALGGLAAEVLIRGPNGADKDKKEAPSRDK